MPADRPNILFIFTDQQNRYALGCMDNPDVLTPNLDRLAEEGVRFTQAYSSCPICTAARINWFTGRYSNQTDSIGNGAPIPPEEVSFARALGEAGYRTAFVGKWHIGGNGNGPVPRGLQGDFDEWIGYQCYNGFLHEVRFWDQDGACRLFDTHRTDVATDLALEKLDAFADGDAPFALVLGYQAPHYPEEPSEEYVALYEGRSVAPRPNAREGAEPYTPTHSPRSPKPRENDPNYRRYGGDMAEYRRLYNAMVTQIDANVGRILQRLDALGIADETAVLFTSDHGDMQGSHGLVNKCLPHEESAGVPLLARVPGGARGVTTDALTGGVDIMPTCLDLAGAPVPERVAGRSFAPLLRGEAQTLDGPVFSEFRNWRMIRTGPWKLVTEDEDDRPTMLIHLPDDPYELVNLADAPEHAATVRALREEILAWRRRCRAG